MKYTISLFIFMMILPNCIFGQNNHDIYDFPIPENIEQCFKLLDLTMTDEHKSLIKSLQEDSIYFHKEFMYGADFVDAWKINENSRLSKYFNEKGLNLSFEIYETILVSYHRYLNGREISLAGQIENYNFNRQKESIAYQHKQDSIQRQYPLNKMINESLLSYLNWKSELISKIYRGNVEYVSYICVDHYPGNFSFSEEILNRNVKFMSLKNLSGQNELKKGKEYKFVFMEISLEKNRIIITLSGKNVSIPKKNHLNIALEDWGICTYEYSCESQKWVLIETKNGGI